jgi:hypothetical protein
MSKGDSPTLILFLALVSIQAALMDLARPSPSSDLTCLLCDWGGGWMRSHLDGSQETYLDSRSVLEPTMTHGILFTPQKSMILSYTI